MISGDESKDLGEKAEIRRELRMARMYIEDPELRQEVSDWITRSHELTEADTAEEFLERELNELLEEYAMYHSPATKRGEDDFPDSCKDCRHYGSACPVLLDLVETDWRERKLQEAGSEHEARRVYQEQARDVGCVQIPRFLNEYDTEHREFILEGQQLVDRVHEDIHEDPGDLADPETETAVADGGEER